LKLYGNDNRFSTLDVEVPFEAYQVFSIAIWALYVFRYLSTSLPVVGYQGKCRGAEQEILLVDVDR